MTWIRVQKGDHRALALADRHYNRQKAGARQFMPPGRTVVLLWRDGLAVFGARWAEHVKHEWRGAWECTIFRREPGCDGLASEMILQAIAHCVDEWGPPPAAGMLTFVDPAALPRGRRPGHCFEMAGFRRAGWSRKRGRLALVLGPDGFPAGKPAPAREGGGRWWKG